MRFDRIFTRLLAYSLAILSASSAAVFGFMSSTGPFAWVKAGVLVGVALVGCQGFGYAYRLKGSAGWVAMLFALVVTTACLGVTVWSGLGSMATGNLELSAERGANRDARKRLEDDRKRALAARDVIGVVRPSKVIQAERDRWNAQTAAHARLEAERVKAVEAEKLEARIAELGAKLDSAPPPLEGDAEALTFSILTGVSLERSAALKALFVSVTVELAAMLAFLVVAAGDATARPRENMAEDIPLRAAAEIPAAIPVVVQQKPAPKVVINNEAPKPAPAPKVKKTVVYGSVKKFLLGNIIPQDGERVELGAVLRAYRDWCKAGGLIAADTEKFLEEIEAVAKLTNIEIVTEGDKVYCAGIILAA